MIGILPRYNTMKCQLQSMSGTVLGSTCCKMSKINFRYPTYHEIPVTVNKCQVSYLEMLGTYSTAGSYTRNCQVLKCHIHELQQVYIWNWNVIYMNYSRKIHETVRYWNVIYMNYSRKYMKLSGIEMSYTWTTAGKYMKVSGIEMSYTWTTAENTWNSQILKCHTAGMSHT